MQSLRHFHLKCRRLVCTNFCDGRTGQKQYVSPTRETHIYYLCTSCQQGRDITTTYVLPTKENKTTTYVLLTMERQNYYLCLADKGETYLLYMCPRQGEDKTITYVSSTRGRQNYYLCLADKGKTKLLPMSC